MVAMPYILANIVLGVLSWLLFCVTSAALLSKYASLGSRRVRAFLAHLAALLLTSVAVGHLAELRTSSPDVSDTLFFVALANAIVLAYQFMDRRYFLAMSRVPRALLLGSFSVLATCAAAFAMVTAVVGLTVIR